MKYLYILLFTITGVFGQNYHAETGEILPDSTQTKLIFDPTTGIQILDSTQKLEIQKNDDEVSNNEHSSFTNIDIINKAKADAYNYFNGFAWSAVGGPSTIIGASIMANIGNKFIEGVGSLGGLIGGLYFLPKIVSKMNVNIPYYNTKFVYDNYSDKQLDLYVQEYENEIRRLRKTSIHRGQGLSCLGCGLFMIFLVAAG